MKQDDPYAWRIIQSRIFVVECEHEQKTKTSGKVRQMRSASPQHGAHRSTLWEDDGREGLPSGY